MIFNLTIDSSIEEFYNISQIQKKEEVYSTQYTGIIQEDVVCHLTYKLVILYNQKQTSVRLNIPGVYICENIKCGYINTAK